MFQPHTFSRLYTFFDEICASLSIADKVIMADVYAAREINTYGVTSRDVAQKIGERASYGQSLEQIKEMLLTELEVGDQLVIMGAGDIFKLFDIILEK